MFYKTVWSISSKIQTVKMSLEKSTASDLFLAAERFKKKMTTNLEFIFCFPQKTSCIIKCHIITRIKRKQISYAVPFGILYYILCTLKCISRTELQN